MNPTGSGWIDTTLRLDIVAVVTRSFFCHERSAIRLPFLVSVSFLGIIQEYAG